MAPSTVLADAINSAEAERLRKTLMAVIEDENGRAIVEKQLLLPEAPGRNKRKRYETCEQCDKEFDVTENAEDACVWHSGELEPDYDGDFWADHDEDCHGIIDSDEMRKEYPEGFKWDCCDKDGTAPGCEISEHTASVSTTKKSRS